MGCFVLNLQNRAVKDIIGNVKVEVPTMDTLSTTIPYLSWKNYQCFDWIFNYALSTTTLSLDEL